jgi:hypothetical protein
MALNVAVDGNAPAPDPLGPGIALVIHISQLPSGAPTPSAVTIGEASASMERDGGGSGRANS